jgi:hypothetical protein
MEDDEAFATGTGIWHIVDRRGLDSREAMLNALATRTAADGQQYLVAFTDEDLAQRFIERSGDPNLEPFPFDSQVVWLNFLEDLPESGHEYIGFDPEGERFGDFGKIATLIDSIRESLSEPE